MGGGEGGAYLKNRDQIFNKSQAMHARSDDTRAECRTYGLTETGATFNDRGEFCERQRCELLGGSGACSPR